MNADFEYEVVTNGESWRVRWKPRGGWFFGLWPWSWVWLTHEVNCGFAGTDTEITEFSSREAAVWAMKDAIRDDQRRNAREAHGWRPVESATSIAAVDPVGELAKATDDHAR